MQTDCRILAAQLQLARQALPGIDQYAQHMQQAFTHHDVPVTSYVDARQAALSKQIDIATLTESLTEADIALDAILGNTLPDTFTSTATTSNAHA